MFSLKLLCFTAVQSIVMFRRVGNDQCFVCAYNLHHQDEYQTLLRNTQDDSHFYNRRHKNLKYYLFNLLLCSVVHGQGGLD